MTFANRVKQSELPLEKIVVIGSGLIEQCGGRSARDIDLAVAPELLMQLAKSSEWRRTEQSNGRYSLERGDYELWDGWDGFSFQELYDAGQTIDGVRFAATEVVIAKKRSRGAEKDLADIAFLLETRKK